MEVSNSERHAELLYLTKKVWVTEAASALRYGYASLRRSPTSDVLIGTDRIDKTADSSSIIPSLFFVWKIIVNF